jgi:hypothetical protein
MGIRFRWAGYRMPDEIGQKVDVKDVGHYVAMRGRMQYAYDKHPGPAGHQPVQVERCHLVLLGTVREAL